jgi:hypothetical protein
MRFIRGYTIPVRSQESMQWLQKEWPQGIVFGRSKKDKHIVQPRTLSRSSLATNPSLLAAASPAPAPPRSLSFFGKYRGNREFQAEVGDVNLLHSIRWIRQTLRTQNVAKVACCTRPRCTLDINHSLPQPSADGFMTNFLQIRRGQVSLWLECSPYLRLVGSTKSFARFDHQ